MVSCPTHGFPFPCGLWLKQPHLTRVVVTSSKSTHTLLLFIFVFCFLLVGSFNSALSSFEKKLLHQLRSCTSLPVLMTHLQYEKSSQSLSHANFASWWQIFMGLYYCVAQVLFFIPILIKFLIFDLYMFFA